MMIAMFRNAQQTVVISCTADENSTGNSTKDKRWPQGPQYN
jgi:hypothetical protein